MNEKASLPSATHQASGEVMSKTDDKGYVKPELRQEEYGVLACDGQDFESLSSQILGSGRRLRFQARGSSMYPFVKDGDVLLIEPVDPSQTQIGDAAFYRDEQGRIVVHRVVGTREKDGERTLTIRGDAVRGGASQVLASQVLGRVIAIERGVEEIRLDGGFRRWVSLGYVKLHPLGLWICDVLRRAGYVLSRTAAALGYDG